MSTLRPAPPVVVIEGVIGAGKSVLTCALAGSAHKRGLETCVVPEPVKVWENSGALKKFYENPKDNAYAFQTFVYATRVVAIADAVRDSPHADLYLLDRSPATDRVFMAAQDVSPVERAMYETWCDTYDRMQPLDLRRATAVYLQTPVATCMERIMRRGRAGELDFNPGQDRSLGQGHVASRSRALPLGVTTAYQTVLAQRHDEFLLGVGGAPPTCPYGRVVCVPAAVAAGDFTMGGSDREAIADAVLDSVLGVNAPAHM